MPNFIVEVGNLLLDDFEVIALGGSLGAGDAGVRGWVILHRGLLLVKYYHVYAVSFHR